MKQPKPVGKMPQPPRRLSARNKKPLPLTIVNTQPIDWVDKQVIMQAFHISERTLQYYRSRRLIPCSSIGGKVYYYMPGFLRRLEENIY